MINTIKRTDGYIKKLKNVISAAVFLSSAACVEGFVHISESFNSSAANMQVIKGGAWSVSGGRYVLTNPADSGQNGILGNISVHNKFISGNFTLSAIVRITGTSGVWDDTALVFNYQNQNNYYYVSLNESNDAFTHGVFKVVNGAVTEMKDFTGLSIAANVDYPLEVQRLGASIKVLLNGSQVASFFDKTFVGGKVGFGSRNDGGQFDNLLVTVSFPTHPTQTGLTAQGINRTSSDLNVATSHVITTAQSNSVISDVRFTSTVNIQSGVTNVTFRRCWFPGSGPYAVRPADFNNRPTNITFEDCDFGQHGLSNRVSEAHIAGLDGIINVRRCFFYNSADSIKFSHGSVNNVEESWFQPTRLGSSHTDAMQFNDAVVGKVYATRSTFEIRTWSLNGQDAYSQEELTNPAVTVSHWGNGVLQAKPCFPDQLCGGPVSGTYYSIQYSLMTGGNYIMTAQRQTGQFSNNVVIRGSGSVNDLGLRDPDNLSIYGNVFHDGGNYTGGGVGKTSNHTPIWNLGL